MQFDNRDFTDCIEKAYSWANKELIRIVLQEKQLVQRLQSIKQYFFLESGDLFMHFIQTAKGELIRDPRLVSQEKLQSLLELSIRTSNSEKDPFKDDVTCYLSTEHWETVMPVFHAYFAQKSSESMTQLEAVLQKEIGLQFSLPGSGKADPALRIYCFDYFTLDYNVEWPLNLILSDSNMMVYKVVFRHLFNMRIAERELYSFWKQLQSQRSQNMNGGYRVEFVLVQRMINFLKTVQYNFFYEVIEEHWRTLMTNLKVREDCNHQKVTIFSDAVACHKEFIENIARDTLVADPDFSKILKKILVVCMFPTRINLNHPPVSKKFEAGPKGRLGNQMDEERRLEAGDSRKDPFKLQGLSNKFDSLVTTLLNYMEKQ